ncbi:hypothetical protein BHE82_02080 [Rice orange leaf phytoplasma]|nr:hypothetical protein BHE82_02080 [Rice orange leaf phytoplasma]
MGGKVFIFSKRIDILNYFRLLNCFFDFLPNLRVVLFSGLVLAFFYFTYFYFTSFLFIFRLFSLTLLYQNYHSFFEMIKKIEVFLIIN